MSDSLCSIQPGSERRMCHPLTRTAHPLLYNMRDMMRYLLRKYGVLRKVLPSLK